MVLGYYSKAKLASGVVKLVLSTVIHAPQVHEAQLLVCVEWACWCQHRGWWGLLFQYNIWYKHVSLFPYMQIIPSNHHNGLSQGSKRSLVCYNDVIMSAMACQITSLTIVYPPFIQAEIRENIKAPCHWPLYGEFTGDQWIPRTKV